MRTACRGCYLALLVVQAGGSLAGILFAILVGTDTIAPFQAIGNAVPFLHGEDATGQVFGALLFFTLAVVLARFGSRKLSYTP